MPRSEPFPQAVRAAGAPEAPEAYAGGLSCGEGVRGAHSDGTAPGVPPDVHDGGMAGLDGREQPRGDGRATASRWSPTVEDEHAQKALELFGDPSQAEVPLPSRPESAATARRLTQVVILRHWGLGAANTEDAVLLVSELVGNAVRHTGARVFGLRLRRRPRWIRVEVRDPSRSLPCLMPVQELDISGRGLFLVDTLADRWGVDLLPRGKTTWFEMRVTDR